MPIKIKTKKAMTQYEAYAWYSTCQLLAVELGLEPEHHVFITMDHDNSYVEISVEMKEKYWDKFFSSDPLLNSRYGR